MTKVVDITRRNSYGDEIYKLWRVWEVQKPPYRTALPFTSETTYLTSCTSYGTNYSPSYGQWVIGRGSFSHAANLAYEKLVSRLGEKATWANNMAEASGSLSMISSRAGQLTRFANKLRKGDIIGAAKVLEMPEPPKRLRGKKAKAKSFGDQFLEFHFGWEPAVQDIGAAVRTLDQADFGVLNIIGRQSEPYNYYNRYQADPWSFTENYEEGSLSVLMGARARISNPNAFLANQMGFVNPLSVAWEAVPYSFVVDWFTNVGQVIASYSDFVGVSIENSYTTTFQRGNRNRKEVSSYPPDPRWDYSKSFTSKGVFCQRTPSISGPVLEVKPFKGFSSTRGATAIALLLQKL